MPYVQCPSCRLSTYSAAVGYLDRGLCPQCGERLPVGGARVIPISRHPRFLQEDREDRLADDAASS